MRNQIEAHLERGWDLVMEGNIKMAMVSAHEILKIDDDCIEAHNLMGYLNRMDGDLEEAFYCYEKALELDEDYMPSIIGKAEILSRDSDNLEETIELTNHGMEIAQKIDQKCEFLLIQSEAFLLADKTDELKKILKKMPSGEKLPVTQQVMIGRLHYEVGDFSLARKSFFSILNINDKIPDVWYYLGLIDSHEGNRIGTLKSFLKTWELDRAMSLPPWVKEIKDFDLLLKDAVNLLPEKQKKMLNGTRFFIKPAISKKQLLDETDPRKLILASGISLSEKTFKKLCFFYQNLPYSPTVEEMAEELSMAIAYEIGGYF